jgi:hypothetical protein
VIVVCRLFPIVGFWELTVDFRMSLSMVVVWTWLTGIRLSGVDCWLSDVAVSGCCLELDLVVGHPVVGCWLLIFGCRCRWLLFGVGPGCRASGCRVLAVDCRMSLSVVIVWTWLSVVGCLFTVSVVSHFFRCRCRALDHKEYVYLEYHRVFSPPPNWYSPAPSPASECVPLRNQRGNGTHLPAGEGVGGGPNSDD